MVGTVDQAAVIKNRREECHLSERYLFMVAMSGGIAILGLLLSSPAVVIGAMLLSPLMGPIIGLGFALAIGDYGWLRESALTLAWGTVMAILLCALVVFFSPLQEITSEIAARTRPNLFDLGVAVFSALAGAYAMIRGREGTIVGVAIATALMPPLAVVGFGLATANWTVFSGALLLYVTNLMAIALIAALMARLYGFRTNLSERQTLFQNMVMVAVMVALTIPLGLSLIQIARESTAQRIVRGEVLDLFDGRRSRLSQLEIDWQTEPIRIDATVLTPRLVDGAEAIGERALTRQLERSVELNLTQYQVGTSATAAEEAALSASRAREEAVEQQRVVQLAERLSLVAGVPEDQVTIDRQRRRALVRAQVLEGASLDVYRTLEQRIAATEPEWLVQITPPVASLPAIEFVDGEPTESGMRAIELIVWAGQRLDLPIELIGYRGEMVRATELLAERGVNVTTQYRRGVLQARWADAN